MSCIWSRFFNGRGHGWCDELEGEVKLSTRRRVQLLPLPALMQEKRYDEAVPPPTSYRSCFTEVQKRTIQILAHLQLVLGVD